MCFLQQENRLLNYCSSLLSVQLLHKLSVRAADGPQKLLKVSSRSLITVMVQDSSLQLVMYLL